LGSLRFGFSVDGFTGEGAAVVTRWAFLFLGRHVLAAERAGVLFRLIVLLRIDEAVLVMTGIGALTEAAAEYQDCHQANQQMLHSFHGAPPDNMDEVILPSNPARFIDEAQSGWRWDSSG